jgi:serine/threonine protein kinase
MHRDLKPQNIVFGFTRLDEKGKILEADLKIVDFGLAQVIDDP